MTRPGTLGELRASGWESRPVKEEVRSNAIARVAAGQPLVDGVIGFEDTVIPQLENALLAGPRRDLPRRARAGEDPHHPLAHRPARRVDRRSSPAARSTTTRTHRCRSTPRLLVAERGDETPIEWVHRDRRFGEKLATPDTSIADLIGEVDPIKVAEGRYLSDELTIHYGLVPRTNRGIFAINELPDLAERIQVGLLNVLEERDVQIRGYKIRLPLDLMLVASANPEDYTNRGRIITPLKDRFGAQIRTHYPLDVEDEMEVVAQEARPLAAADLVVAGARVHGRDRGRDQPAGPPVAPHQPALGRVGPALDRELRDARRERHPAGAAQRRAGGRPARRATSTRWSRRPPGKIEIETLDDGREEQVLERIVKASVLEVFRARCRPERLTTHRHRVRRGTRRAHRRGSRRRRVRVVAPAGRRTPRGRRRPRGGRDPGRGGRGRRVRASRGCTSPSASTRTPSPARRRTALAAEPARHTGPVKGRGGSPATM